MGDGGWGDGWGEGVNPCKTVGGWQGVWTEEFLHQPGYGGTIHVHKKKAALPEFVLHDM